MPAVNSLKKLISLKTLTWAMVSKQNIAGRTQRQAKREKQRKCNYILCRLPFRFFLLHYILVSRIYEISIISFFITLNLTTCGIYIQVLEGCINKNNLMFEQNWCFCKSITDKLSLTSLKSFSSFKQKTNQMCYPTIAP